jgi:hypothetical protein
LPALAGYAPLALRAEAALDLDSYKSGLFFCLLCMYMHILYIYILGSQELPIVLPLKGRDIAVSALYIYIYWVHRNCQ